MPPAEDLAAHHAALSEAREKVALAHGLGGKAYASNLEHMIKELETMSRDKALVTKCFIADQPEFLVELVQGVSGVLVVAVIRILRTARKDDATKDGLLITQLLQECAEGFRVATSRVLEDGLEDIRKADFCFIRALSS